MMRKVQELIFAVFCLNVSLAVLCGSTVRSHLLGLSNVLFCGYNILVFVVQLKKIGSMSFDCKSSALW